MVSSPLCSSSPNGRRAAAHNACYCITMENGLLWSFCPKIRRFFLCGCGEEGIDKSFVQTAFLFQRCFHAVDIRNNIKKKMTLERVHSTTKKSKKAVETTEETRKAELELFLKRNVCINKNEYIQLSGLTRHAAIDELNKFILQGFLRRRGMGRSTVYVRQEKDTANEI